ncbi:type I-E CRISPR-associated protein Cas6/Cse3/CasE [Nocardiopsis ansamitocini]|uniref:CRISPR-associated endoribonuclease Cse3 n=1 Tax=Nocardiopsis ansamitocini TaxID=1670832 RepID=A0A9W6UJB5_9ACTN|nr:type I-E CRISPR-associated protein Cas6/Cse3/CasE [Nocardiopsis ansamitocini]GLU48649.1 CRISPR-associated endoribonuclease Cse3 [Nocardiopsis ansamitocini]
MSDPQELWLTQIVFPTASVGRFLRDARKTHQMIMGMFPDDLGVHPRRACGALYRIEPTERQVVILVQSTIEPKTKKFAHSRTLSLAPLLDRLTEGATVRYRIAANPIKSAKTPGDRSRGQRKALHGHHAEEWWERKAHEAGLHLTLTRSRRYDFAAAPPTEEPPETDDKKPDRLLHHGVRFEGLAEITDPKALTTAIVDGIGRGKAHGLGLLSIIPQET